MRPRLLLLLAFVFGISSSCKHDADPAAPTPLCYSGVVLQYRCNDGYLIQVDARYRIGKSIDEAANDLLPPEGFDNDNVIAAVNDNALGYLKRGQSIYFTYENDPQQQRSLNSCFVFGALAIPHFVLSNVSITPCTAP